LGSGTFSFKRCASFLSRKGMIEQIFCNKFIKDYEIDAIMWKIKKEVRRKLKTTMPFCIPGFMGTYQIQAMFEGVAAAKVKEHLERYKRFNYGQKRYMSGRPGPMTKTEAKLIKSKKEQDNTKKRRRSHV
jgi:hypothetical protein